MKKVFLLSLLALLFFGCEPPTTVLQYHLDSAVGRLDGSIRVVDITYTVHNSGAKKWGVEIEFEAQDANGMAYKAWTLEPFSLGEGETVTKVMTLPLGTVAYQAGTAQITGCRWY